MTATCPVCQSALSETARPHCMEKRAKPCGWVVCKTCDTTIDRRGNHYPRAKAA